MNEKRNESSVVILKNRFGHLLLLLRAKEPFGWGLPGGRLEPGESPITGIIRETMEETGIKLHYRHIAAHKIRKSANGTTVNVFVYTLPVGSDIRLSEEHHAYMWTKEITDKIPLAGNTREFIIDIIEPNT